jgi:uncharacterized protein YggE
MRYLIILISFISVTGVSQAQNVISVNASAEVLIPADKISFRITLNAEEETPQEAYDLHKERENVLTDLLKKHEINEKNINFEPILITKRYNNRRPENGQKGIITRQTVILSLDNFDKYEEMQVTLIENGFDEFSGNFMSSEFKKGETEALTNALKTAREKADIIARETGLTIRGIKDINYSYNQDPPRPMMEARASSDSGSLMEFDQSVSVSASVSVSYHFEE